MFEFIHQMIGKLSVSRKLTLIYLLDLSAVIFVSSILINEKYIAINFARNEIEGNSYISAIQGALLSDHPGKPKPDSERSAPKIIQDAESRFGKDFGTGLLVEDISSRLVSSGGLEVLDHSNREHLIHLLKSLITRIGNQSNLILDPDLDSYYTMSLVVLRFPELFDLSFQIGDKAREVQVESDSIKRSQKQTEYLIIEGRLKALADQIATDYGEAMAANAALHPVFESVKESLLKDIDALRTATRVVALGRITPEAVQEVENRRLQLKANLSVAWSQANQTLEGLLAQRVDGLFSKMWWHLGTAVIFLFLILSVVFFVARMVVLPVRRLSDVAARVSQSSDYSLRAEWSSQDELGRLVNAFNRMLEQLDRSRLIEQELAASARAAIVQQELLEAMPIALMVTEIPRHEVLHANRPAQNWLQDCSTDPWVGGLDNSLRIRFFQQLSDTGAVDGLEVLWQTGSEARWALLSARLLRYQGKNAVLTTFTPIGQTKLMEARLALWAKVFEASSESILVTNAQQKIATVNRAFCRSSGYEFSEVVGDVPHFMCSNDHPEGFYDLIWKTAKLRGSWQGELSISRKNGEVFPAWAVFNAVRDEVGEVTHYVVAYLDISERKESERRISYLAHHDTLTDLPNRALCLDRLNVAIQQAERNKKRVGVLFLDLDRFKNINDSLGHHIGDGLLRSVASRLLASIRAGDTVSRLGGDEFVVIFNGVVDAAEIRKVVDERLVPLIRQPHDVEGTVLHVSCSVGIAVYPEDGEEVDVLMKNADAAMYQAKHEGRDSARFFTPEMDRKARDRIELEIELRSVVERGELLLCYQPRVEAGSGRIVGVEALVRWKHPERGLIEPSRFIPVAEESGLIVSIGYWIFGEVCRQHLLWRESGIGSVPVSVNISPAQFRDAGLINALREAMQRYNVTPSQIELELTESLLMKDMASTVQLLQGFKALGVSLAVDDFGTGYSSLNYLSRFPIDKLKIDQSFVSDILEDAKDRAITEAIIGLGHALGLGVVAEGVESIEQKTLLLAAGCDELQGYLFSKPISGEEFSRWSMASSSLGCPIL